ncbi:SCO2400 family protein [Streptomyces sp. CA-249302]|uniref:SCO2400 family protein n=1 Tax=Streptomyces sp. CA-249302 TaxID=3240058 RepID=UPI003D8DA4D1
MDYCSSCRRHLNGALVCPGCGAYAPDIAPMTGRHGRTAPATAAMWPGSGSGPAAAPASGAYGHGRAEGGVFTDADDEGFADLGGDVEIGAPATVPAGRAARRRQRARWKKNQRRAVVATAVALVGGGLTVASMDRGGNGQRAEATTATDLSSMGTDELPADQSTQSIAPGTGKHRKPDTTEASNSGSGKQSSATGSAAHTESAKTQPYTAATPNSTPTTASAQQSTTTSTTGSTSTSTSASTASSTSTDTTGTSTSTSSGSSTSTSTSTSGTSESTGTGSSDTSSDSTSPSGLCVLNLICVS